MVAEIVVMANSVLSSHILLSFFSVMVFVSTLMIGG